MNVTLADLNGHEWRITTEHSQSSYGIPVLVAENGNVYGPGDHRDGPILRGPLSEEQEQAIRGAQAAGFTIREMGRKAETIPDGGGLYVTTPKRGPMKGEGR